ncbi:hypothetical protein EHM92_04440 [bacterium]|nr:MAG: hypothetical protein EHM92_04440 [bacterium]
MKPAYRFVADFDSTTSMVVALGGFLHGSDKSGGGAMPVFPLPLARTVNALPRVVRRSLYRWSGWWDAVPVKRLAELDMEQISTWVTERYPERPYPAIMLGSSNGAAAHLCAALGIPALPQTFLVPIRRSLDPDALHEDMAWGKNVAAGILRRFPDILIHQMHDPIQDRLMVERMGYFRIKKLRLGNEYERFIKATLSPGGTIFLLECRLRWPSTQVQPRHLFQTGGYGGMEPEEILDGSERVKEFLQRQGALKNKLQAPKPDAEYPEAEWGFSPELGKDVEKFAREHGHRIRRISFHTPDQLSPLIADLYTWWYQNRKIRPSCLLGECFALLEPYWVLRTGSVPYWLGFNTDRSAMMMEQYLGSRYPFHRIHLMLMSNGIEAVGIVPVEQWRNILRRGVEEGTFLGMSEEKFPLDLGSFGRYHREFVRTVKERHPMPEPLGERDLDSFLEENGGRYEVEWKGETPEEKKGLS